MMHKILVVGILVILVVLVGVACAPAPTATPVPPTAAPTQPPKPTDAPKPTETAAIKPTVAPTAVQQAAAPTQTPSRPTATPFPTPRPPIRIAWLPWVSSSNEDGYINGQVSEGVELYMKQPGVLGDYILANAPSDYEKNLNTFVQKGYPLIFTIGVPHAALTAKFAAANPNGKFAIEDYAFPDCLPGAKLGVDCWSDKPIPNVRGLIFQVDEGAFLAGYLAAGMSKSGKVGTLGGLQVPTVTIYMKGFQAGVEYFNTQKKASVKVLGWDTKADKGLFAGTLSDSAKVQVAAKSLIDDGADVIMPVAGDATGGGLLAAKAANGVYGIGVDVDQCFHTNLACEILLTSVEKELGEAAIDTIKSTQDGKFQGGVNYVGTLKNGGVELAPFNQMATKIPDSLKKELDQVEEDLKSGKIKTGVDPLK
jgi:basic membrane protein A and related proteins